MDTVLTDEQIAAMTAQERGDLIKRLARPVDEVIPSPHWLRRTREVRIAMMVLSAVGLVPWTVYLAISLPRAYVAHNWDLTWVGFDVLLITLMVATAVLGWLRRQLLVLTAFTTGVLLVCDAWFDVMTASNRDRGGSLFTALLIELPLAALLVGGAFQVLRLTAARFWMLDPGAHVWQIHIPLPSEADHAVRRSRRGRTGQDSPRG